MPLSPRAQAAIVAAPASVNEPSQAGGVTPLMAACRAGAADACRKLLAAGTAIDARSTSGVSALACCAVEGHTGCAELLLSGGASAVADVAGWSPLMLSCQNGHLDTARLLLTGASAAGALDATSTDGNYSACCIAF
jgi:ankyrin repeat protein